MLHLEKFVCSFWKAEISWEILLADSICCFSISSLQAEIEGSETNRWCQNSCSWITSHVDTFILESECSYSEIPISILNSDPALIQISFQVQPSLRLLETRLCLVLQTSVEVLFYYSASNQIYSELHCGESKLTLTWYMVWNLWISVPLVLYFLMISVSRSKQLCHCHQVCLLRLTDSINQGSNRHRWAGIKWTYFESKTQLYKQGIFWRWWKFFIAAIEMEKLSLWRCCPM